MAQRPSAGLAYHPRFLASPQSTPSQINQSFHICPNPCSGHHLKACPNRAVEPWEEGPDVYVWGSGVCVRTLSGYNIQCPSFSPRPARYC